MPRKGGKRKKRRTHVPASADGERVKVPETFVMRRGKLDRTVSELVMDVRRVMMPYTATRLRERKHNSMKDFVDIAGPLGVTHFLVFSQAPATGQLNFRVAKLARGPTLTFKVLHYTLRRHVRATQLSPVELQAAYLSPPLLVLNNFSERAGEHVALVDTLFRGMFPSLNVATVKLAECRRAVLLHRMPDDTIEFRHYAIRAAPRASSRPVKMLLASRVPDLGHLNDIADAIGGAAGGGAASDSEADEEASTVELAQKFVGRGNVKAMQSVIKLVEIGPRLTLRVVKVEQGMCTGEVLYHAFVSKTAADVEAARLRVAERARLKAARTAEQAGNVARKAEEREAKRAAAAARRVARARGEAVEGGSGGEESGSGGGDDAASEDGGSVSGGDGGGGGGGGGDSGDEGDYGEISGADDDDDDNTAAGGGGGGAGGGESEEEEEEEEAPPTRAPVPPASRKRKM